MLEKLLRCQSGSIRARNTTILTTVRKSESPCPDSWPPAYFHLLPASAQYTGTCIFSGVLFSSVILPFALSLRLLPRSSGD